MKQRRGQTATEYLIILAVVIIIALIVIGVLSGIPSIGGGAGKSAKAGYWKTAEVGITGVAFTPDGNASLVVVNNKASSITIQKIKLTDATGDSNESTTQSTLTSGQAITYNIYNISSGTASESYAFDVEITYTDVVTGANYIFTGAGNRLEGVRTTG